MHPRDLSSVECSHWVFSRVECRWFFPGKDGHSRAPKVRGSAERTNSVVHLVGRVQSVNSVFSAGRRDVQKHKLHY